MDATLQTIIEAALQQGIWAALYIYLFFRMLKENAAREERYQQMIDHLSNALPMALRIFRIVWMPCHPRLPAKPERNPLSLTYTYPITTPRKEF